MFTFERYKSLFNNALSEFSAYEFYKALITKFSPHFPTTPGECAIIGIRTDREDVDHREDHADDTIVLCRIATDGVTKQVYEYAGTTESGRFAEAMNILGDFKMAPGFYVFKHGLHHAKYPCLVQAAPVRGQRAKKHTDYAGEYQITDGSLHLHAGILNLNHVGNYSAGCQVIAGGWQGKAWLEFMKYISLSQQAIFPYVLVNESEVERLIGV